MGPSRDSTSCARRSPVKPPEDAGSIPATSTPRRPLSAESADRGRFVCLPRGRAPRTRVPVGCGWSWGAERRPLPAAPARVRWPVGVHYLAAPAGASPRCAFSSRRAGPCPLARGRPLPRCAGGCFASVCVLFPPRRPVSVGPWASPSSLRRRVLRLGVRSLHAAPARVRWPVGVPFLAAPAGASPRCAFSSRRAGPCPLARARPLPRCAGGCFASVCVLFPPRRPWPRLRRRVPFLAAPARAVARLHARPRVLPTAPRAGRTVLPAAPASDRVIRRVGVLSLGRWGGTPQSPQNDALAAGGARRSVAG